MSAEECLSEPLVNLPDPGAFAQLFSDAGRAADDIHEDEVVGFARQSGDGDAEVRIVPGIGCLQDFSGLNGQRRTNALPQIIPGQ